MAKEYAVSYLIIGGYVGFVVVSTLLVGLLPALVNLPYCKEDARSALAGDLHHEPHNIEKRDLPAVSSRLFEERQKRGREAYESQMESNPLFRRLIGSRVPIDELKECPELQSPLPGVEYPWYLVFI